MEIEYWSDIACPFCYIGSTRMKRALRELGLAATTLLKLKAFQLDPMLPTTTQQTMVENFAHGHGMTTAQAEQQIQQISQMGASDGLNVDLQHAIPTNTLDAHRLIKLAATFNNAKLVERVIDALYQVYFSQHLSIADLDVLRATAIQAGLPADQVQATLETNRFAQAVRDDEHEAHQLGIQGAPFFVINHHYGLSGAQPYATMVAALKQIQDKAVAK
ncbi:DsbA family oxidoreductase [Levilactobacillus acidifarinae]|uniref:Protein-disulfide isomerase n=1 Tax=Levilactobacillus acidifarinae DSM 19394 = JCM 15949 TaxID=1423715 RepID=A0A0R1LFH8_9LACO|nr:DsbA family oxidoreductase [Levilactobacillus acidifarinae]KRK94445.1 protein-disulfide isomerase [Levilactobacillus acidifarinae DSM 19394]GEO68188.1 protein disulfide-isomerase [Levilactobacillus acidifarinae]